MEAVQRAQEPLIMPEGEPRAMEEELALEENIVEPS